MGLVGLVGCRSGAPVSPGEDTGASGVDVAAGGSETEGSETGGAEAGDSAETGIAADTSLFCWDGAPAAEIGGGEQVGTTGYAWEPLEDGAARTLVHGPQGGWHIEVSPRAYNLGTLNLGVVVDMTLTGALADGTEVCRGEERVGLTMESDCVGFNPDMYCYLDVSPLAEGDCDTPPELLVGQEITLKVAIRDDADRGAEATLVVVGAPDDGDPTDCE